MKQKFQRLYFAQGKEGNEADTLILSTETLNTGRVLFFKSYFAFSDQILNGSQLAVATVPNYMIAIVFSGNLATKSRLQLTGSTLEALKSEMEGMAAWLLDFKINPKPRNYRDFLLSKP